MDNRKQRSERRTDALSRERIVEAAIEILDADGEAALTFRALASRLSTGSGAIYWHVADKGELLAACADAIVVPLMHIEVMAGEPREGIRLIALGIFDAIDRHPWVGSQLFREPWRFGMLEMFETVGARLLKLGVPDKALFDCVSALVSYILGVAGQNAANARMHPEGTDRSSLLAAVAARWEESDAEDYVAVRKMATQLRDHDDRAQFLAGIDLLLDGIAHLR